MELKKGDLVQHVRNKQYGIVMSKPVLWRGDCMVCQVSWCFINNKHLIDVDYLDKINEA